METLKKVNNPQSDSNIPQDGQPPTQPNVPQPQMHGQGVPQASPYSTPMQPNPYGYAPQDGYQAEPSSAGMRMIVPVDTSPVAIVAGYFGLFSLLIFPGPIALALGIAALYHINRNPKWHGKGRAIFAIVMGGIMTLLMCAGIGAAVIA
ncbi:MAG: DUF4190 domain-containing protein [Planctomycetota bacterium]